MARIGVFLLLISHLIIRVAFQLPSIVPDLIIFNLIAFLAAYVAWKSPRLNDRLARLTITFAILLWATWINSFNLEFFLRNTDL
jgi:hypothetical protein